MMLLSSKPVIKMGDSAKTNIVFVGNSIVDGTYLQNPLDRWEGQLSQLAPLNGNPVINLGQSGVKIDGMIGMTNTSPAWQDGKANVMLFYEGTNQMRDGVTTGETAFSILRDFCAARLAEHPWKIVLISTFPAKWSTDDAYNLFVNTQFSQFNALMKANYRSIGAVAYCDVVTGTPWGGIPNFNAATFNAEPIQPTLTWDGIHPSAAGFVILAAALAPQLRRIPLR